MQFQINKTEKGMILLNLQVGFLQFLAKLPVREAHRLGKLLQEMASPTKVADIFEGDDLPIPDGWGLQPSSSGLILRQTQEESIATIFIPAKDLFDFEEDIRRVLDKILGQKKKDMSDAFRLVAPKKTPTAAEANQDPAEPTAEARQDPAEIAST